MPFPTFARGTPLLALAKDQWRHTLDAFSQKRKLLAKLRAHWGRPGDKSGFLASRYFELARADSAGPWVDDKTWNDLEFPETFARMDTTATPIGSQLLYAELRKYLDDPDALARRYAFYLELARNAPLRETLQLRLSRLGDDANADLTDLLFDERPDTPLHKPMIWGLGFLSVALLALSLFFQAVIWPWFAVLLLNFVVIYRVSWRQQRQAEAMQHCAPLLVAADSLAALNTHPSIPRLRQLHDEAPHRTAVRKSLYWFAFMQRAKQLPVPFVAIPMILNFAFLLELAIHAGTVDRFFAVRAKLRKTFLLVGEIDAAIAIASWLEMHPRHCAPALVDRRILSIREGLHPLLPKGIASSIRLDRQSILVTGSNMAGKTTFIKMLAANAILGQTLGVCLAAAATIPFATVMASMHDAQSVQSGKSHYFAEIEAVDGFIRQESKTRLRILAIDEPFSGTNTIERIAIARAVLESLGTDAIVLATTHDVELQALLGEDYVLYHFQENPDVDGFFDYALQPGPATERNAIRLLDRMGFPKDVIASAMDYAKKQSQLPAVWRAEHLMGRAVPASRSQPSGTRDPGRPESMAGD